MHTSIHSEFTGKRPASPRNGLRLIPRSPWRPGFLATIAGGSLHRLDTSIGVSGPHGFAVRVRAVRQERIRIHRIPARVRDDRETPLSSGGTAAVLHLIWVFGKSEYFCKRGWTGFTDLPVELTAIAGTSPTFAVLRSSDALSGSMPPSARFASLTHGFHLT
jgi:hypothetical protein